MAKLQLYGHSPSQRRYITRYQQLAFDFAIRFAGNITTRQTPDGGMVYEIQL